MKRTLSTLIILVAGVLVVSVGSARPPAMPWANAGLTREQAAAHLLDRFAYGATPALLEEVIETGLEEWFERQLDAGASSSRLEQKLAGMETLSLDNEEIALLYPRPGMVRRQAIEEGRFDPEAPEKERRAAMRAYYEEMGYRPQRQIIGEAIAQQILRGAHSPNQIEEVMVNFWFNHFYVSATDNQCRRFVGTYERDAIRPHVFRSFTDMLTASARHPAMLLYLDNAQSSAPEGVVTTVAVARDELRGRPGEEGRRYHRALERMEEQQQRRAGRLAAMPADQRPRRGINENYARELLELHTLGVDGGYAQDDVIDVARALTGWTVLPEGERRERIRERLGRNSAFADELGFVIAGDFFFNPDWHDAEEKRILGRGFPAGGGLEEGEVVLEMLAAHPATARFVSRKLAVRFVSDDPPQSLVEVLASVFLRTNGDNKALLRAIVSSDEFWSESARGAKIKSPFELAISSVRALDGDVRNPGGLARWIERMGQPLYRYQAPTGFPDRAQAWVNAGSLLHRMNFGMTMGAGKIRGVHIDVGALNSGREPESPEAALETYARILIPGRDLGATLDALRPLLTQPDVVDRIRRQSDALDDAKPEGEASTMEPGVTNEDEDPFEEEVVAQPPAYSSPVAMSLSQVIGLILGSPEFQRR